MLRHLHIKNLILIEDSAIDFTRGLTVLTGETGAGKSIVLDALALLAGSNAPSSLVRTGSDRATVEAVFEVPAGSPALPILGELGLEGETGEVILRREVSAGGRGRAAVNGRIVPAAQLREIASALMELNGQHDQHKLLSPEFQRDLFDEFAGLTGLRGEVRSCWEKVRAARAAVVALEGDDRDREQRADFLRFQVAQLEAAEIRVGELEELENEVDRLSIAEKMSEQSANVLRALAEGESGESSALDLVGTALSTLERIAASATEFEVDVTELRELQTRLGDLAYEVAKKLGSYEVYPERLGEAITRLEKLKKVLRKHGPSEEEALGRLSELARELESLETMDSRREEAQAELVFAQKQLARLSADLTAARDRARPGFTRPLETILRDFALPKVRIAVGFDPIRGGETLADGRSCGPHGAEDLEILFSANSGVEPQPLRRIGSGGELSRVMLALRTLEAERTRVGFLVFDEVDAGISGTAARRVAERLAALGERSQVLCVTHNAAVAACAHQHLLVEKQSAGGATTSSVTPIIGVRREGELARLLDGGKVSERGRALAAELLAAG